MKTAADGIFREPTTPFLLRSIMGFLLLFTLFLFSDTAFAQTQISNEGAGKFIHVNIQHLQASDRNPGTEKLPLKSISKAAELAEENKEKNIGTKVLIYPGIYREQVSLSSDDESDAPIVFEAGEKGKVVISGSDVWTDWKKRGDTNIYTHHWPYKWGFASIPPDWEGQVEVKPIVRRKEMMFVNGRLQKQVLSFVELKEGSFYVSEKDRTVYLRHRRGIRMESSVIEVATRSNLFDVEGKRNIVLRGLTFIHDNASVDDGAVTVANSSGILVEDCRFLWNNWHGLNFYASENVTVLRNVANHNGGSGMIASVMKNLVFEDNETSYNNWRGAWGKFYYWAVSGIKSLFIHDGIYRRHKSVGNQTNGFWIDTDNVNITIEDAFFCDNLTEGLTFEASQGPIILRKSIICYNRSNSGILAINSSNVTLESNIIYGNTGTQIKLSGIFERPVTNRRTGEEMMVKTQNWTFKNNIIVSKDSRELLIYSDDSIDWKTFLNTLTSEGNLWYVPNRKNPFIIGNMSLDFDKWKSATGQDLDSTFADPRLKYPKFGLLPDSIFKTEQ